MLWLSTLIHSLHFSIICWVCWARVVKATGGDKSGWLCALLFIGLGCYVSGRWCCSAILFFCVCVMKRLSSGSSICIVGIYIYLPNDMCFWSGIFRTSLGPAHNFSHVFLFFVVQRRSLGDLKPRAFRERHMGWMMGFSSSVCLEFNDLCSA